MYTNIFRPGFQVKLMTRIQIVLLLMLVAVFPAAQAQEGHPLVGTWQGNWGEENNFLTLIMNWDGQGINGIVNPGPQSSEIESARLDSSRWHVEMNIPLIDETGNTETLLLDGQLENVATRTRSFHGTWHYQGQSGSISLIRQGGA